MRTYEIRDELNILASFDAENKASAIAIAQERVDGDLRGKLHGTLDTVLLRAANASDGPERCVYVWPADGYGVNNGLRDERHPHEN